MTTDDKIVKSHNEVKMDLDPEMRHMYMQLYPHLQASL
jgi:hypothetical protein